MSVGRRSMADKIYQQRPSVQRSLLISNPQERKLNYPRKGDTSFDPSQYGKKHLSPKHSAIHSIIFNNNFNELMKEKDEIVKKLYHNKKSFQRYQQNDNQPDISNIHDSIDDYLQKQQISIKDSNILQKSKSFRNESNIQNVQKIRKGHLYRHSSINQVLRPFEKTSLKNQRYLYQDLQSSRLLNNSSIISLRQLNKSELLRNQFADRNKDFPRYINPNNLNSIF